MASEEDYGTRIAQLETDVADMKSNQATMASDISEIKRAVVGDKEFRHKGLAERVEEQEKDLQEIKMQKKIEKATLLAIATTIGLFLGKGLEALLKLL